MRDSVTRSRLPLWVLVGVPLLVVAAMVDGLVGFAAVLLVLLVVAAVSMTRQR
ncbi:MAG: hypothetical protein JWM62_2233 [Frankiales bacterium]|jgi:hypothetical protein|nr:hypothetical protein [Frankiales bacterium]